MTIDRVLLHLITPADWRAALAAGSVTPPSFVTEGFVHLSHAEQLPLPANRLFAGRQDLLLLVIDPARIERTALRYEPGVPTDPASMVFPHLYAPLPVAAVTSVLPYRPAADGRFAVPVGIPAPEDHAARATGFDRSVAERRAAVVLPVAHGVAVLDPRVRHSYEHNTLWMCETPDAATVWSEADRVLRDYAHRRVVFDTLPPVDLGWDVEEFRLLVRDPSHARNSHPADDSSDGSRPSTPPVVPVAHDVVARLWDRMWRQQLPAVGDDVIEHLLRRERIVDAHVVVIDLVVPAPDPAGVPLAGAQLRIDGATAAIEAVLTVPEARGRGYARAVVLAAIARAEAAGCDVIFLAAAADDWPRHWYERLGFRDVGARWEAMRPAD